MQTEEKVDVEHVITGISHSVKKIELENGLRLIMMKRTYAPTVAFYIKFLAGGADETPETQGIAHMLEHMLFKGTPEIGTKNYDKEKKYIELINAWAARMDHWKRVLLDAQKSNDTKTMEKAETMVRRWKKRIESLSKTVRDEYMIMDEDSYLYSLHGQKGYNAYTSRDLTNYQIQLPRNRQEVWAKLESDRIANSVLRDFYTERDVVAEERRMRVDNVAANTLIEEFLMEAYGDHPYGKPLIGSMESIQFMTFEQAYHFYKTYYSPNNMVIAIVGDIDYEETEQMVRKYFGNMESKLIPRNQNPVKPEPDQVHVKIHKNGSPFQIMAWFKPSMPDPDDLHLEVLSRLLAGSRDSRLFRKLVIEKRVAARISTYSSYPGERYTNMFLISAVPAPGKTYEDVERQVLNEIQDIHENGVTKEELERVRTSLVADMIYSLRSNAGMADRLSYYETLTGDYRIMFDVYREIEELTTADIQVAAKDYLTAEKMMTAKLYPPETNQTSSSQEGDR